MNNMITATAVFEELRFVWELLAAELIFLFPFAKVKEKNSLRVIVSAVVLGVCAQFYFFILQRDTGMPSFVYNAVVVVWYLFLVLVSLILVRYCFLLTFTDTVYMVTAGYSAQHIVYVVVHEILAKEIFPELSVHLGVYILLSLLVSALWYFILYLLFEKHLSLCSGRISDDNWKGVLRQLGILLMLMISTFTCQHIFEGALELRYYAALLDCMLCALILLNLYNMCRVSLETKEKVVLAQMKADSARFYSISKELIETVNRKSHDMKHALNALEHADTKEQKSYINETRKEIDAYQQMVHTDYEELNTILAEKSIYCESQKITLNCVISDIPDNVVSALDLYILLGNAIDNAVESVTRLFDDKKRVITVNAGRIGSFISIQINNYYEGELKMKDGYPITTKKGRYYHGFGLKSIRSIAHKYGGDISIDTENGIFSLQIMIPF